MTGYGSSTVSLEHAEVSIEVKAVNHRFLDMQVKLPNPFQFLEESIRRQMKRHVFRGKLDVVFHLEENRNTKRKVTIDEELLEQFKQASDLLQGKLGSDFPLDLSALLLDNGVVQIEEMSEDKWTEHEQLLQEGLMQALLSFNNMRETEGNYLKQDMLKWLQEVEECCDRIEEIAPMLIDRYREKIEERIKQYTDGEIEIDESRLLTEIAIFSEKMDISEELVRMKAHVIQYKHYLDKTDEAIGRRLDFLLQEMNRELNTIGSKAADSIIRQHVVELKGFIEKLKEQVQNVE